MHITHSGSRHLGILSLLSLVACNDAQLKTLGEIETGGGGGGSAGATGPTQSSGAASGGSTSESIGGAQPSSAAGSGGSLPKGAGGSLPNAGGSLPNADGGVGGSSPNAGTAGVSSVDDGIDACSNKTWTATATVACKSLDPLDPNGYCGGLNQVAPQTPAQAIDGDPTTRYTTGQDYNLDGTEEFVVTFPSSVTISGITVDPGHYSDYALAYALEFSTDGLTFARFSPPITGAGMPDPPIVCNYGFDGSCTMAIPFPPTAMRAVKFKQIGFDGVASWWSIAELKVIACKEN